MKKNIAVLVMVILLGTLIIACSKNNSTTVIKTKFDVGEEKVELEKVKILSNKIEMLLPRSFSIMSEEMAKTKYPSERRPTLIYTNEDGSINVALNHTQSKATNEHIPEYLDSLKSTFENLYPSAKWYKASVEKKNGKNVGVLELETPAIDTEIYNLIWFTDLDGRLLLCTFNCTKKQMNDWKPIAKSIMDSQQVK